MSAFQTAESGKENLPLKQTATESEPGFDGDEREAGVRVSLRACQCYSAGRGNRGRGMVRSHLANL